jgi:hypothetical protein
MRHAVRCFAALTTALALLCPLSARAAGGAIRLDRAVVRFLAPETGGVRSPRFVYERVLAFEARIEALADPDRAPGETWPYRERHVRAALERHVAETLLASLKIEPEPTPQLLAAQTDAAQRLLTARIGSAERVAEAAGAEGIDDRDILRMLRRQARASLYLDRMVAPMLAPSDADLANIHRTAPTPFRHLPFAEAEPALRRWYVSQRLAAAVTSFFQNARSRIRITVLDAPPGWLTE